MKKLRNIWRLRSEKEVRRWDELRDIEEVRDAGREKESFRLGYIFETRSTFKRVKEIFGVGGHVKNKWSEKLGKSLNILGDLAECEGAKDKPKLRMDFWVGDKINDDKLLMFDSHVFWRWRCLLCGCFFLEGVIVELSTVEVDCFGTGHLLLLE